MTGLSGPRTGTPADLLAIVAGHVRLHPDDGWAAAYGRDVPPMVDELAGARAALVEVLGSEGAVPLGGLAAGIRKVAAHAFIVGAKAGADVEESTTVARWDGPDWTVGGVGC